MSRAIETALFIVVFGIVLVFGIWWINELAKMEEDINVRK